MVLVTFTSVVLRYGFSLGWIWLQESYIWLHGIAFMLGAGYTLLHDGHVRVDLIYRGAGPRYKAWVDLCGALLLLMPTIVVVAWFSWSYVIDSWIYLEGSSATGGLPGLFLLKTVLLVFCGLVGLQGLALAGRSLLMLRGSGDADAVAPTNGAPSR